VTVPPAARAGDIPDLPACDREPIHIPGAIQRHGVLLAADPKHWIVEQASENTAACLGGRGTVRRPVYSGTRSTPSSAARLPTRCAAASSHRTPPAPPRRSASRHRAARSISLPTCMTTSRSSNSNRNRRRSTPIACSGWSIDYIDHFKRINDEHGHQAGDEVLRAFTDSCRAQARSGGDLLGRLGGEEFAMLLPETTLDAALAVAERIRAGVVALRLAAGPATLRITVSIGVTQHTDVDAAVDALIARADGALYDAKKAGRDRVVARSAHGA
jgi:diguanylate cyclase (GGDEF)-like protein